LPIQTYRYGFIETETEKYGSRRQLLGKGLVLIIREYCWKTKTLMKK
jgi:hypothetical protein